MVGAERENFYNSKPLDRQKRPFRSLKSTSFSKLVERTIILCSRFPVKLLPYGFAEALLVYIYI